MTATTQIIDLTPSQDISVTVPEGKRALVYFNVKRSGEGETAAFKFGADTVLDIGKLPLAADVGMLGPFVGIDGANIIFSTGAATAVKGVVSWDLIP